MKSSLSDRPPTFEGRIKPDPPDPFDQASHGAPLRRTVKPALRRTVKPALRRTVKAARFLALACLPAALFATLLVSGGCAPLQVVEVRTDPPRATVFRVDAAGRTRLGIAPVRFTARAETPFLVRAEKGGYAPAEGEIPGRDVQAFLELHLAPRGATLDDTLLLRLLLIHGPQRLTDIAARAPELGAERGEAAAKRLLGRGEIRALQPRGRKPPATRGDGAASGRRGADLAPAILDVSALGFRLLEARGSADGALEQLLVGRLALYRRWQRAARLLRGPGGDDRR